MAIAMEPRDYDLNANKGPQLRALLIVMIILPCIALSLRFWSRALLMNLKFWWDDWFALMAFFIMLAMNSIGVRLIDLGLGRHVEAIHPMDQDLAQDLSAFLKLFWVNALLYHVGLFLVKTSTIIFYYRIFEIGQKSRFRYALAFAQIYVVAGIVACFFAVLFECTPVSKTWNSTEPGYCSKQESVWLASSVVNVTQDVIIISLPMFRLWTLKINKIQKLLLSGLFALASGVLVVAIGGLIVVVKTTNNIPKDPTFNSVERVTWLILEIPIAIVCVSLPAIVALGRRARTYGIRAIFRSEVSSSRVNLNDPPMNTFFARKRSREKYYLTNHSLSTQNDPGYAGPQSYQVEVGQGSLSPIYPNTRNPSSTNLQAGIYVRHDVQVFC